MNSKRQRILLVGGGHSHVEVLRRFALDPDPRIELTLVAPDALTAYSGMLPGVVAGHYTALQASIPLAPLAMAARAEFICDRVLSLDLYTRIATLEQSAMVAFDLVALDVGAIPDTRISGALDHAIGVKPVDQFLAHWEVLQADVAAGAVRTIAVVGGGAAGVEMLLAMQFRLRQLHGDGAPRFALITDAPQLLPQHAPAVRARLGRTLVQRDVVLHFNCPAVAVDAGAVVASNGRRIAADRIVWAIAAAAPRWLADTGLECDERGFVVIDETLRSTSHPQVFASGDCASQPAHPRPKSGVYAVRQGPPLAHNLRAMVQGASLRQYVPQRDALALITCGDRYAIAARGGFTLAGKWVWRWKDHIDRKFVARYLAPLPGPASAAPLVAD